MERGQKVALVLVVLSWRAMVIFFFQHSSWKTGKAIRAVGCSFLWPSLLEVTDYPQLATLEPVPHVPWASTLLSHMVSTCCCLLLGADPIQWVPTSLELESKKKKSINNW